MISGLITRDKLVDINAMDTRGTIASARAPFDELLLIDSGLLTHDEVDAMRPLVHCAMARGDPFEEEEVDGAERLPVRFVKTHDAYGRRGDGTPVLGGAAGADGAILIVRDPRDVAPSLAHHNGTSIDRAIEFLNDPGASFCGATDRQPNQFRQRLPGWTGFHRSWADQRDIPVHLVRYEDMKTDPVAALAAAVAFAGWEVTAQDIARAVDQADFTTLQRQERKSGFREAPRFRPGEGNFFRRGESGVWRDELTLEQAARIEAFHAPLMAELGYVLSHEGAAPCA